MNQIEMSVAVNAVVIALVKRSGIHPADFVREVGKADAKLRDKGGKVGKADGVKVAQIVKEQFPKGTAKSILESNIDVWTALVELSNVQNVRLSTLLSNAGINTGDAKSPAMTLKIAELVTETK